MSTRFWICKYHNNYHKEVVEGMKVGGLNSVTGGSSRSTHPFLDVINDLLGRADCAYAQLHVSRNVRVIFISKWEKAKNKIVPFNVHKVEIAMR